ncbi:hypothetical protein [Lactiplantibacillus paraplantarum]|uniref:hypothetical protein n=1 Tax=Lactiplantibacillus paraplantarum TaxID=60520 RepID=UPI0023AB5551|nr:hypothetical protein [Lactiplantibacillus paraplantarum]WEE36913.1 hypothetical protein PWO93_04760 [Lactiplantibacillus paraplantarum]
MNNIKKAIRQIHAAMATLSGDDKVVTFVSTADSIAQQTIIANMAMMYEAAQERVLVLDMDFGNKRLQKAFKLKNEFGLSDYLDGGTSKMDNLINSIAGKQIGVITPGSLQSENVKFLIGDPKFDMLMKQLTGKYDHVLINTPSFKKIDLLDSIIQVSDGMVMIEQAGAVSKRDIRKTIQLLRQHSAPLLGYINIEKG